MAKSPCTGVCKISKKTGLCKGCYRNSAEIKAYRHLSLDQRRAIHDAILKRLRAHLDRIEAQHEEREAA